jgi:hypothetical protein
MNTGKNIFHFFFSLRTCIWLLLVLICLLFYGASIMPLREEFHTLNTIPLFQWLYENPSHITWWLWCVIGVLSLLTANTLLCSIESILRKKGSRQWLLVISPQVIHIGFLFMLFAHLLSSQGSFHRTTFVHEGTTLLLSKNLSVVFEEIQVTIDPSGYIQDWSADVRYFQEGGQMVRDVIRPNAPSFHDGFGIYIKTVHVQPFSFAMIEVSREPGAFWSLIGSILFLIGMITLLILKIKRENVMYRY